MYLNWRTNAFATYNKEGVLFSLQYFSYHEVDSEPGDR